MRLPQQARPTADLTHELLSKPERLVRVLQATQPAATVAGRYLHWDQLRHRKPPKGLSLDEWWTRIKFARGAISQPVPLRDVGGQPFVLATPDVLQRQLHEADRDLSGRMEIPSQLTTPGVRDRYQMSALIEEAITSSQLEGAATTRRVAKEMLRSGRQPRTHDERMISNNFAAMDFVRGLRADAMTPELVLQIHSIVTDGTLDDPTACGRLRTSAESQDGWGVWSPDGTLVHTPPPADQLEGRLAGFCAFANDDGGANDTGATPFLHPIVRSILLHFWIGYDHPFVDGNGRTARALFYWSMLHHGYWLAEYLSVSHILHRAPVRYGESYLLTETDENDTTYFVLYQMDVLLRSIANLLEYVRDKAAAVHQTQQLIKQSALNHRQVALLSHALANHDTEYSVTRHANSHRVTRQTARTDLLELAGLGLLEETHRGRAFVFTVPGDLDRKLKALGKGQAAGQPERRGRGRPPRLMNRKRPRGD